MFCSGFWGLGFSCAFFFLRFVWVFVDTVFLFKRFRSVGFLEYQVCFFRVLGLNMAV